MMKFTTLALYIIPFFMFSACSTATYIDENNDLTSVFKRYQQVADNSSDEEKQYLTSKLWNTLQRYRSNPNNYADDLAGAANNFPFELIKLKSSQEEIENANGCLLVHGLDHNNQPMDYLIKFVRQGGNWVIANYDTFIYGDSERWLTQPECDPAKRHQLYIKHFQAEADK